jgi:hypothetical protein
MALSSSPNVPPAALRIIRLVMATGAFLFGCFGLWRSMQGEAQSSDPASLQAIVNVFCGFAVLSAAGVFGIRALRARMAPQARPQVSLIGWAVAEAAAMFGGVVQILGAGPWPWVVGMAVIALSWAQIPVEADVE